MKGDDDGLQVRRGKMRSHSLNRDNRGVEMANVNYFLPLFVFFLSLAWSFVHVDVLPELLVMRISVFR